MPLIIAAFVVLLSAPVHAKPQFHSGELRTFTTSEVMTGDVSFDAYIRSENWDQLLSKYFGRLYNGDYPDWVVVISSNGHVRESLRYKNREVETLPGERTLWVLVFAEKEPSKIPPADWTWSKPEGGTVQLRYTPMDVQLGPAETVMHSIMKLLPKGAGGIDFSQSAAATAQQKFDVIVDTIPLHALAPGASWYAGMGSVQLKPRTSNRVMLTPAGDKVLFGYGRTGASSAVLNFGNGDRSMVAASVAAGMAFNAQEKGVRSHAAGNVYLLGHLYLPGTRPGLPWRSHSLSLTVGTGLLRDRFFKDFVTGVTWGHIFGATGLVFGAQWYDADSGGRMVWRAAPFVAWNVPL